MIKLRKCPNCKGTARIETDWEHRDLVTNSFLYVVKCTDCGIVSKSMPTQEEAAFEWNDKGAIQQLSLFDEGSWRGNGNE